MNKSIVKSVKKGVSTFDGNKWTVLNGDWNEAEMWLDKKSSKPTTRYIRNDNGEVEEGVGQDIDGVNCNNKMPFTSRTGDKGCQEASLLVQGLSLVVNGECVLTMNDDGSTKKRPPKVMKMLSSTDNGMSSAAGKVG